MAQGPRLLYPVFAQSLGFFCPQLKQARLCLFTKSNMAPLRFALCDPVGRRLLGLVFSLALAFSQSNLAMPGSSVSEHVDPQGVG